MPLSDELRSLLLKYIAGETSEEEARIVEKWLSEDPAVFSEFEQLWDLWYAVGTATNVFRFNVDKGWEAILEKSYGDTRKKKGGVKRLLVWSSAAAAVLLAGVLMLVRQDSRRSDHSSRPGMEIAGALSQERADTAVAVVTRTTFSTHGRERKAVKLPDGSRAWLNGNTTLHFSDDGHSRALSLNGEAFFDVARDAKKPFFVRTAHATIRVLGTRFDVVAYSRDTVTDAILTSGSILFSAEVEHRSIVKHLVPGDKVSINYLSNSLKISQVDTAFYISWKEGKLNFQGQKFQDIAKAMEHKYDVRFNFADPDLAQKRLNGYLDKESLTEALEALKLTLRFRYKIMDSTVMIYQ